MTDNEKAIVWLDSFDFLTYKKKENLLALIDEPKEFLSFGFFRNIKSKLTKFLGEEEIEILSNQIVSKSFDNIEKNLDSLNLVALTRFSKGYPKSLKNIDTPPFVLYCKGNINLLKKEGFAVVGTRHITSYGKQVTEKFVKDLVSAGFTIVSGLAGGVDTVAHTTTLNGKGKTIAVLAGGLDTIYPSSNTRLAEDIVKNGGLLVSEVRPYKKTEAYMFPIRNRIIAGLSKGILVTEAQEKSGVIHTKNYAIEYGKDVFSVPGSIFNVTSIGANRMIVNGQAKAVISCQDILDEYHIKLSEVKENFVNLSIEESIVIEALRTGEKTFQELIEVTKLETKTLNSLLTTLLIRGIIKKLAGNIYFLDK